MKNSGKSDYSTHLVDKALTYINKHTDLNQPEQVKAFIANLNVTTGYKKNPYASPTTNTPNTIKSNRKMLLYIPEEEPIKIPTREKVEMLIARAGRTLSLKRRTIQRDKGEIC